jgi:hypothetical protein
MKRQVDQMTSHQVDLIHFSFLQRHHWAEANVDVDRLDADHPIQVSTLLNVFDLQMMVQLNKLELFQLSLIFMSLLECKPFNVLLQGQSPY